MFEKYVYQPYLLSCTRAASVKSPKFKGNQNELALVFVQLVMTSVIGNIFSTYATKYTNN